MTLAMFARTAAEDVRLGRLTAVAAAEATL